VERILIAGAGVSGLSSASLLDEQGYDVQVLEATDRVGGLARSFRWHGFDCDIAPHRLFTRDQEVRERLLALLPMHRHRRRSRVFIAGRRVRDPIHPVELVLRLPFRIGWRLVWGYLFRPRLPETSFENLALRRFGRGLYDLFFEPYTRKMFGVPPSEISAAWGRQKLRSSGLKDAIRRNSKTFFREFLYPRSGGYGAICEALYRKVPDRVIFGARITGLEVGERRIVAVRYRRNGESLSAPVDQLVWTLPATLLARQLGRELTLRYQPVTLVYLLVERPQVMPYHWVYFGDSDVVINRMAEFKNFAADGAPPDRTVLVAEVTCATDDPEGDVLAALERYGLIDRREVRDTLRLEERYGYPVYDRGYEAAREEAEALFSSFENLHRVGRNAEFRHIEVDENYASALALARRLGPTSG
jgi:protoporphyrinogen oxidase